MVLTINGVQLFIRGPACIEGELIDGRKFEACAMSDEVAQRQADRLRRHGRVRWVRVWCADGETKGGWMSEG